MENKFKMNKRRGLIVYVRTLRQVRQLRKYGNVEYVSRKMRYVLIYMDADKFEKNKQQIEELTFVVKTEISKRQSLNPNPVIDKEDRGFSLNGDELIDFPNEGVEI